MRWVGLWTAVGLSLLATSVRSANINDLGSSTPGRRQACPTRALEDSLFTFQVANKSGANFTGTIDDLQMATNGTPAGR